MPDYVITVADVKDGFETSASDTEIQSYIAFVDQADPCLTANNVADEIGQAVKIAGVRYLLSLGSSSSAGRVKSQRAVSGASRTFDSDMGSDDFMKQIEILDQYRCVLRVLNTNQKAAFMTIGRDYENP